MRRSAVSYVAVNSRRPTVPRSIDPCGHAGGSATRGPGRTPSEVPAGVPTANAEGAGSNRRAAPEGSEWGVSFGHPQIDAGLSALAVGMRRDIAKKKTCVMPKLSDTRSGGSPSEMPAGGPAACDANATGAADAAPRTAIRGPLSRAPAWTETESPSERRRT